MQESHSLWLPYLVSSLETKLQLYGLILSGLGFLRSSRRRFVFGNFLESTVFAFFQVISSDRIKQKTRPRPSDEEHDDNLRAIRI